METLQSFFLIYFQNESSLRTRIFLLSSIFVLQLYNTLDSTNGSLHAQKSWKFILGHILTMERSTIRLSSSTINMMGLFKNT
jgi:hypothetical protein